MQLALIWCSQDKMHSKSVWRSGLISGGILRKNRISIEACDQLGVVSAELVSTWGTYCLKHPSCKRGHPCYFQFLYMPKPTNSITTRSGCNHFRMCVPVPIDSWGQVALDATAYAASVDACESCSLEARPHAEVGSHDSNMSPLASRRSKVVMMVWRKTVRLF